MYQKNLLNGCAKSIDFPNSLTVINSNESNSTTTLVVESVPPPPPQLLQKLVVIAVLLVAIFNFNPANAEDQTVTVISGANSVAGTLGAAITAAATGDVIKFADNVTTVTLSARIPTQSFADKTLTIDGGESGVTIECEAGFLVSQNSAAVIILKNVTIKGTNNAQGAIRMMSGASLIAENCSFLSNTATANTGNGGAVFIGTGKAIFVNCHFQGNSAPNGGAVALNGATAEAGFYYCTIVGNTATTAGSGVFANNAGAKIYMYNSICTDAISQNGVSEPTLTGTNLIGGKAHPSVAEITISQTNVFGNSLTVAKFLKPILLSARKAPALSSADKPTINGYDPMTTISTDITGTARTIPCTFGTVELKSFTVNATVNVPANGSITKIEADDGTNETSEFTSVSVTEGSTVKITFKPNEHFRLQKIVAGDVNYTVAANSGNFTTDAGTGAITFSFPLPIAANISPVVHFETIKHNLTLNLSPTAEAENDGTVTISAKKDGAEVTEAGEIDEGSEVTLTVANGENYEFVKWQDADGKDIDASDAESNELELVVDGTDKNKYHFPMPAEDVELTAVFELAKFDLTATVADGDDGKTAGNNITVKVGDGTISEEKQEFEFNDAGNNAILKGTTVTITAVPADDCQEFVGFFENTTEITEGVSGNVLTFDIADDKAITVKFKAKTVAITAATADGALGTVSAEKNTSKKCNFAFEVKNQPKITATATDCYEFSHWTVSGGESSDYELVAENILGNETTVGTNPITIAKLSANLTFTANFKPRDFTLTLKVNDAAMGSITVNGEEATLGTELTDLNCGDEIVAVPNAGYTFVKWTENETDKETDAKIDFTDEMDEKVYTATFVAITEETPEDADDFFAKIDDADGDVIINLDGNVDLGELSDETLETLEIAKKITISAASTVEPKKIIVPEGFAKKLFTVKTGGELVLNNVILEGNGEDNGGGISIEEGGACLANSTTFIKNNSSDGAINVASGGKFFATNCTFTTNDGSAAINNEGTLYLFHCTIDNNNGAIANENDGRIYSYNCLYTRNSGDLSLEFTNTDPEGRNFNLTEGEALGVKGAVSVADIFGNNPELNSGYEHFIKPRRLAQRAKKLKIADIQAIFNTRAVVSLPKTAAEIISMLDTDQSGKKRRSRVTFGACEAGGCD